MADTALDLFLKTSVAGTASAYVDEKAFAAVAPMLTAAGEALTAGNTDVVGRILWTAQVSPSNDGDGNPGYQVKLRADKIAPLPDGYAWGSKTRAVTVDDTGAIEVLPKTPKADHVRQIGVRIVPDK